MLNTACLINRISRNASQNKKVVAIAAKKTSATNCLQQPIWWHDNHWMTAATDWWHNDTAATDSLFPFPIHYTLIPRPTLHMLVGMAMCHKTILSVSISPTRRSRHFMHLGEPPLDPPLRRVSTPQQRRYGVQFGVKVQSLSVKKASLPLRIE